MPEVNKDWIVKQLLASDTNKKVGDSVVELLKIWIQLGEISEDEQKEIISKFSNLALKNNIVEIEEEEVWIPARPGAIKVGDIVQVKNDSYEGELGEKHNGRRCRVVAVRYGDIVVNSIDGLKPELNGTHYPPMHLLKLVKE